MLPFDDALGGAGVRGMSALWTSDEIAAATGGPARAQFEVTGVTFDSREVGPGDLFVAMPGTVYDGHKFVERRFEAGAAGRSSRSRSKGPHVLVEDTFAALEALGRASRERSKATIIGVTGSVGKTSTKEALYAALDRNRAGQGPSLGQELQQPHRRSAQPRPDAARRRVRGARDGHEQQGRDRRADPAGPPHVAIITAIAPAHIENLGSEEAIADAKAEIFEGLEPEASPSSPTTRRTATGWSARRGAMPTGSSRSAAGTRTFTPSMP